MSIASPTPPATVSDSSDVTAPSTTTRLFSWPRDTTPAERQTLLAGSLGWMLDAMDVMLYSLVLAFLIREFAMDTRTAGLLNSLTLLASAIGGLLFGWIADRIGRTRALMASIALYSVASAACGSTHSIPQLAAFRFLLGLGMGGEWTAGAALIAETWRAAHRGKALGLMQSSYAIGEAIAALVVAVVLPNFGWRAVFFVGVLPALLVFWIRRGVPEPELWSRRTPSQRSNLSILFRSENRSALRAGTLATAMNACGMFGYWGLFTWIPAYLSLPVAQGGRGLSLVKTTSFFLVLCLWKMAGLRALRILRRRLWPPQTLLHVPDRRRRTRPHLRHHPKRPVAAHSRSLRRVLRHRLLLRLRRHRQRNFPRRRSAAPPWASATTSDAVSPPWHPSPSAHSRFTTASARPFFFKPPPSSSPPFSHYSCPKH